MVNAQDWLDENYPKEGECIRETEDKIFGWEGWNNFAKTRREIRQLDISKQNLTGSLDLTGFSNLQILSCSTNQLTNLDVSKNINLQKLYCSENQLTSVEFLNKLSHPEKLEVLWTYNNNIQPTDIACFSKFTNLEYLKIGTTKEALAAGKHNKFCGSLQAYRNLTKLEAICIEAADIDSGLEYLPASLAAAIQQEKGEKRKYSRIECSPHDTDAKCKAIQDQLCSFNYDLAAWQLANFDLVLAVNPQSLWKLDPTLFTEKEKNEKLITALITKISETEQKLTQTREQDTNDTAKIQRIESKVIELKNAKIRVEKELTQKIQTHHDHLQKLFEILCTTTIGFINSGSPSDNNILYNLVKEQAEASQKKIAESEEIIVSFQNQVERVNRENLSWEERFEKLNDDYVDIQAVAGGLKLANNTLKNEWRKTEQELKAKREERQNNLNFFATILNKQKELKKLKDLIKPKLADKNLLKNFLSTQELLTNSQLTNAHQRVINSITLQLTQLQDQLAKKITREEINQLCQVKHQLVELELELENLLPVNLEAKVEIR
jgi:hypothetical protein